MTAKNYKNILVYIVSLLISFGIGIYLYYEWFLILLIIFSIFVSGYFLAFFSKQSRKQWLFLSMPFIGLSLSFIIGLGFIGSPHKSNGPSLNELAASGNPEAQYTLALLDIFKKEGEPEKWLLSSAEQGNPKAQYMLGLFLAGRTDPRACIYAYMWLRLAENRGHPKARGAINQFLSKMNKEQISEAESLVNNWKPKINAPNKAPQSDA